MTLTAAIREDPGARGNQGLSADGLAQAEEPGLRGGATGAEEDQPTRVRALPALCPGQFAFLRDALMRFARALDAIFELTAIVRELLGDFVGPARYIATDCGLEHHGLTDLEFM